MPQRNLLILLVATAISYACYATGAQNPYARYAAQALAVIEAEALQRVPSEELFNAAMDAMVGVLHKYGDEHSQFISRDDAVGFRDEIRQQFGGIGVRIRFDGEPPKLVIVGAPEPGSPADRADVRAGDLIPSIDKHPTVGMTMSDVLHAMRGEPGTPIQLEIQHAGADTTVSLTLVREVIIVDSILGDRRSADGSWEFRLESDQRIALVRVTTFANRTTQELADVLRRLTAAGVEAVVLDLRDDAGGALDAVTAICDMLLPAGLPIVEIRGRDGLVHDRKTTKGPGQFRELRLAVLVNNNSASASEILAACLQDHGRAVVVGQRTFGKGTVQKLIPTESDRSLLKLTSASFWRPNGRNIHRKPDATDADDWGVSPDPGLELALSDDEYEAFRDYRNERDLIGPAPAHDQSSAEANSEEAAGAESNAATEFVDRQLEIAVEYLQGELDGRHAE